MTIPKSPWDNGSFVLKSYIACGTTACMNWTPERLQQIRVMVYIPTYMYIYTVLDADRDTNLLGPFYSMDVKTEPLCVQNNINLPTPFVGLFLKWDLTPVETWTHLCGTIVNGGLEVDCFPIPPHLQRNFPDVGCNEQPLDPLEGGVQPEEVVGEHVVSVL